MIKMIKVFACGVLAAAALACTKPNPNYCEDNPNKDCSVDAASGGSDGAPADTDVTGAVTIDVLLGNVASSGRVVIFHEPNGAIAEQAMTNAFGSATGMIHTGGMVTVAVDPKKLVTITDVAPGDHIVLNTRKPYDATAYGTVAFSATVEASGKSYYRNDVGTNTNYITSVSLTAGTDRTLGLEVGNLDTGGKINPVSAAYNSSNQLVAYNFKTSYAPTANGTTSVSYTGWLTDIVSIQTAVNGAPTDAIALQVESANETSGFQYIPVNRSASISGGAASVSVPYLGSFGDYVLTQARLTFPSTEKNMFTWTRRAMRPAGNYVIAASDMPPRLSSAAIDTTTPTRPSAQWTVSGSGGDATIAIMFWEDGAGGSYQWYAYVPPDVSRVTFPVVPAAIATQSPGQTSIFGGLQVIHHDLEPLAGYAAFRVALPVDITQPETMPAGFTKWVRSETSD